MLIKLIAFDVDGTLVKGNVWERLHKLVGIPLEEDYKYFYNYYHQKITFKQWTDWIIKKYRQSGITKSDFELVMSDFELLEGVVETLGLLRRKYELCLISSGVDFFIQKVATRLNISLHFANYTFIYDHNNKIRNITYLAPENKAKVILLKQLCCQKKILPENVAFIGDSLNDLDAFRFTKRGIYIGAGDKTLEKTCWKKIKKISDLKSLVLK